MWGAYFDLGFGYQVAATGGSATTIVDTNTRFTVADSWKGGTAFVLSVVARTLPAIAPVVGEYQKLTAFDVSTKTFTTATFSQAIAAGDVIGLTSPKIPALEMAQAVNNALKDHVGTISQIDISIPTTASTQSYTLPAGVMIQKLLDVLLSDTDGDDYYSIKGEVKVEPSVNGGTLIAPEYDAARTIKIIYNGLHPALTAYSSIIHPSVPEAFIKAAAVDKALLWLVNKRGSSVTPAMQQTANRAIQTISNYKIEMPVNRQKAKPKLFSLYGR